jgi:hypothetical protein
VAGPVSPRRDILRDWTRTGHTVEVNTIAAGLTIPAKKVVPKYSDNGQHRVAAGLAIPAKLAKKCCTVSGVLNLSIDLNSLTLAMSN